ncbi:MAG: cation:proton antiporter [Terriglobia bacterium]
MEAHPTFFRDLAYVFLAAITGGLLARWLRQPIIIGYVVAGILISRFTPGPSVTDVQTLELFAEIGVVLLMFSIGLEFSVKDLLREKWVALIGGPLGILLSIAMALGAGHLLGWTVTEGVVVGAIISVASTMVLTRLLLDQGQLHTTPGRVMVAITLVEDLALVIFIVLIPQLGNIEAAPFWTIAQQLGLAIAILVPAFFIAAKLVPPLLQRVARTQSRELFFIVVLAICLSTAALTQQIGLSLALGAFVAGLLISESDYAHEALVQLFPLRDSFVALFFVTIGLLIDPRTIFSNIAILGTLIALIVFGKFIAWSSVVRLFGYPMWVALSVAVGLTQIGEFSFVLVQVARNAGIVGNDVYTATLAASLVTILMNSGLVRYVPARLSRMRLAKQMAGHAIAHHEPSGLRSHVVLCGFGRVGSSIGTALETFGVQYAAIDLDPDIHGVLRSRGIPSIFGDATHPHILSQAAVERASLVIVTLPDPDRSRLGIMNARRMNPKAPIMARAHQRADHEILIQAGATEVIQPELEASATAIRHAFRHLDFPDEQVRAYLKGFREAMNLLQGKPSISRLPFPEMRELTLPNSSFTGLSLRDAGIRERFGVTIISITKSSGRVLVNPPPGTILEPGDKLRVFGLSEEIDTFVSRAVAPSQ